MAWRVGDAVPFYFVACPRCGSRHTRVAHTERPVRRHKCLVCRLPFKSVERRPDYAPDPPGRGAA